MYFGCAFAGQDTHADAATRPGSAEYVPASQSRHAAQGTRLRQDVVILARRALLTQSASALRSIVLLLFLQKQNL